jgi:hypothetical protein
VFLIFLSTNLREIAMKKQILTTVLLAGSAFATSAMAGATCADLPKASELKKALVAVMADPNGNGGVQSPQWLSLVDASGTVCAVVHSEPAGTDVTTHTSITHRVFSVGKAGTSNGFSTSHIGVSTAQLWYGSQYDQITNGLSAVTNSTLSPFVGDPVTWGTLADPLIGKRAGTGVALPGGLPLYNSTKTKVGAIGVSGDFRCTDHVIAWKVREKLRNGAYTVANNVFGVSAAHNDAMMQDIDPATGKSASGFGFVRCDTPTLGPNSNPTNVNDGGSIEGN